MTAPAKTTIRSAITLFAPIEKLSKQADGTMIVDCVVSSEAADDQGEIVTYEAIKKAAADYMTWANVREMHQPSAVGTTVELNLDDDLRKVTAQLHIVDPLAVAKIEHGVYKGVSIGGRKTELGDLVKVGGKDLRKVTGILWNELSLADRPSNGNAVLTLVKRAGGDDAPAGDAGEPEAAAAAEPEVPAAAAEPVVDAAATPPAVPVAADLAPAAAPEGAAEAPAAPGASTGVTAADAPLEAAAKPEDLKKSAVDEIYDANYVAGQLATMIEAEALDEDNADAVELRKALAIIQGYAAKKGTEVGTPADVAERAEEIAAAPVEVVVVGQLPMYYAAVTGDLAKRAIELAKVGGQATDDPGLDALMATAAAAGGRCAHDLAKTTTTDTTAPADLGALSKLFDEGFERSSDALLLKVTTAIGQIVRPDALDAMKGELLEAMQPLKEELAKIAAQPAPGGPARYAMDARRFGGTGEFSPANEADVLNKAAAASTDPVVKEALGILAATAQIREQQSGS